MSRRSYLLDDLPHNRALWPEEYRELEQLDLLASRLIRQLKKIHRTRVLVEIEKLTEVHREFFRDRLNYWHGAL
ncbi:hypothetical protein GWI87_01275 [Proteus sp. G4377]|uniref:hypothetical protein n=1 Tax=Proteus TaxID=583 RepID=UPI001378B216|nr:MULTISPECIES: hypothetical protein [Proteus]MDC6122370.1 hypothetical protein [Proteus mirabilis]MDC6136090.1 hypothetical protein [Proteus mirabilis]NBN41125.1 hypothetical protein [Proteus sp. G4377]